MGAPLSKTVAIAGQFDHLAPVPGKRPVGRAVGMAEAATEQTPVTLLTRMYHAGPRAVLAFLGGFAEEERERRNLGELGVSPLRGIQPVEPSFIQ